MIVRVGNACREEDVQRHSEVHVHGHSRWRLGDRAPTRRPPGTGEVQHSAEALEQPGHQHAIAQQHVTTDGLRARCGALRPARGPDHVRGSVGGVNPIRAKGLRVRGLGLGIREGLERHAGERVGAELGRGPSVSGGARSTGDGVEGGVDEEGVQARQEQRHRDHALARVPGPTHPAPGLVAVTALLRPVRVCGHEGAVDVTGELLVGAARRPRQDRGLDGLGDVPRHTGQPVHDGVQLGMVKEPDARHGLGRREGMLAQRRSSVQDATGAPGRDPKPHRDLAHRGPACLLSTDEPVRAIGITRPRPVELGAAGQSQRCHGLRPLGPGDEPVAGSHELAEPT